MFWSLIIPSTLLLAHATVSQFTSSCTDISLSVSEFAAALTATCSGQNNLVNANLCVGNIGGNLQCGTGENAQFVNSCNFCTIAVNTAGNFTELICDCSVSLFGAVVTTSLDLDECFSLWGTELICTDLPPQPPIVGGGY